MNKKYAPYNDDVETNPDKDFIGGPYSTFDPELAEISENEIIKGNNYPGLIKRAQLFSKANEKISRGKAKKLSDYILHLFNWAFGQPHIASALKHFDSADDSIKVKLGQKILDDVTDFFNIDYNNAMPKIKLKRDPTLTTGLAAFDFKTKTIKINFARKMYLEGQNEPVDAVTAFFELLRHEYAHAVDMLAPHLSALGAQTVHVARKHYVTNHVDSEGQTHWTVNKINPLEANAYRDFDKFGRD